MENHLMFILSRFLSLIISKVWFLNIEDNKKFNQISLEIILKTTIIFLNESQHNMIWSLITYWLCFVSHYSITLLWSTCCSWTNNSHILFQAFAFVYSSWNALPLILKWPGPYLPHPTSSEKHSWPSYLNLSCP